MRAVKVAVAIGILSAAVRHNSQIRRLLSCTWCHFAQRERKREKKNTPVYVGLEDDWTRHLGRMTNSIPGMDMDIELEMEK